MRYKIFILIVLIFFFKNSFTQISNKDTIYWTENLVLSWCNFKGEIPHKYTIVKMAAIKINFVSIGYLIEDIPYYTISCFMLSNKSYAYDSMTQYDLDHEKLHFDIYELYTRRIRKELIELNNLKEKDTQKYTDVIYILTDESSNNNNEYDNETGHGEIKEKQEEWRLKIDKELKELDEYSSDKFYDYYLYLKENADE
jgi:hypothetical protein